jgi:hypothetical protein
MSRQTKYQLAFCLKVYTGSQNSYGLDGREIGVRVPVRTRFSPFYTLQTGSGVHPASYTMGTAVFSPGVKQLGREADHSSPTSDEVKNTWMYTSNPLYVFMT